MKPIHHVLFTGILLLICLLWFELTPTDIWLQKLLYHETTHTWLWDRNEKITLFLFYDGIKVAIAVFGLGMIASLFALRKSPVVQQYRKGMLIVSLSLILVPAIAAGLKATTNVACPRDLSSFGGNVPYVRLFEHYPAGEKPQERQRCYPAGHASGGFALMSLFFLFHTARNRKRALLFGITTGWLMGTYKMLIGDHFLSHTIVTMLLAWLIICAIAAMIDNTELLPQGDTS
jgi:membrane-associated PAP2 superfamily phosphatase